MTTTFGPELDAEIAYRRETLLRGPSAGRGRGWLSRLLRNGDDPAAATGRVGAVGRQRRA
jgi:hypothetical protein